MLTLSLGSNDYAPKTVLCIGCHSDDIEIGCGGTILRLIQEFPAIKIHWVVLSAIGTRRAEAEQAARLFTGPHNLEQLVLKDFPDGFMPYVGADVKSVFEALKPVKPDLIFTHQRQDAHQDHRLVSELTWNTFRNHLILEYEIPKYDGDMGQPSVFFPLNEGICARKIEHLMEVFATQRNKGWFDESTFWGLMRLRGMECNSPSRHAEAFYCRKIFI